MKPVKLDLSNHCVQTEIGRLYNQSVSDYFKKDVDKDCLEERIELLKNAMESFDFQKLRSRYVELSGGGDSEVYLEIGPHGQPIIKMNQKAGETVVENEKCCIMIEAQSLE